MLRLQSKYLPKLDAWTVTATYAIEPARGGPIYAKCQAIGETPAGALVMCLASLADYHNKDPGEWDNVLDAYNGLTTLIQGLKASEVPEVLINLGQIHTPRNEN